MSSSSPRSSSRVPEKRKLELLHVELKKAESAAKTARSAVATAKSAYKAARKKFKQARKTAKQCRKQAKSLRREFEQATLAHARPRPKRRSRAGEPVSTPKGRRRSLPKPVASDRVAPATPAKSESYAPLPISESETPPARTDGAATEFGTEA